MDPVAIVILVVFGVILLLGLWSFAAAAPESAESMEKARLAARAKEREQRAAETFLEDAPLVLALARAPSPDALAWSRAPALEDVRAVTVATRQELPELLVAATGEELEPVTVRDSDLAAHRPPTFGPTQHPLAGRIDLLPAAALAQRLATLRRWAGEGKQELAEALVEFDGEGTSIEAVVAAIDSGSAGAQPSAVLEAAALVRPLREAAEAAAEHGHALALAWLPSAEHVDVALGTVAPAAPPAPTDAAAAEHASADALVQAALTGEVTRAGHEVTTGGDGLPFIGTTGVSWRAWTSAREARGRAVRLAVTVEARASVDGQPHAFRAGFAALAPTVEDAARLVAIDAADELLSPVVGAALPPRVDRLRWETGLGGEAPAAYEVHAGPLRLLGQVTPELVERLSERHPFHVVKDALRARLGKRAHLVELHAEVRAGAMVEGTCRLDGEPFPEGLRLLQGALPFPDDVPFVALRGFVVLRAARGD